MLKGGITKFTSCKIVWVHIMKYYYYFYYFYAMPPAVSSVFRTRIEVLKTSDPRAEAS